MIFRQSTTITMAQAVYKARITPSMEPYHLPKKDRCHPKARGHWFFTTILYYQPSCVIYVHATKNVDL